MIFWLNEAELLQIVFTLGKNERALLNASRDRNGPVQLCVLSISNLNVVLALDVSVR